MIHIIVPTLNPKKAKRNLRLACSTAGCTTNLIVVHDTKKERFTKTVNRGLRQTKEGDVCILNDDVIWYPKGWLKVLHKALHSNGRFGIACPSGMSSTNPMRGGKLGMQGLQAVHTAPFWCVLIKRRVINTVGLLDERMVHYASDTLYCEKVKKAGFKIIWVKDVWLKHKHHGSGLVSALRKKDQAMYRKLLRRLK